MGQRYFDMLAITPADKEKIDQNYGSEHTAHNASYYNAYEGPYSMNNMDLDKSNNSSRTAIIQASVTQLVLGNYVRKTMSADYRIRLGLTPLQQ